jgi:hypothetical protein
MKWPGLLAGALLILSPLARADGGQIISVDGPRLTVRMGLMTMRTGEMIQFHVIPDRRTGGGYGVVTDVDPYSHTVAVVLAEPTHRDDSNHRERKMQPFHSKADRNRLEAVKEDPHLFPGDVLLVKVLQRYIASPPDFMLPRQESHAIPTVVDLEMPTVYYIPKGNVTPTTPGSPANTPDLNQLLTPQTIPPQVQPENRP